MRPSHLNAITQTTEVRGYPFDLLDIGFGLLTAMSGSPLAFGLALLQYFARRSSMVCSALLEAFNVPEEIAATSWTRAALPGTARALLSAGEVSRADQLVELGAELRALSLAEIADADNLLVVGPKNSGKTTLLRELVRLRTGGHVALDPHNAPGKWGCRVVGGGLDFESIGVYLQAVDQQLVSRYQAMNRGEGGFRRLTIVGDEWRAIAHELPDLRLKGAVKPGAGRVMLKVISQGRKVGVCFVGAGHADTVESLGIAGEGDMRACFDWIIYLGGLAVRKLPAAREQARPAVAYHTERDTYYLLDLPHTASTSYRTSEPRISDRDFLANALANVPIKSTPSEWRQHAEEYPRERSANGLEILANDEETALGDQSANEATSDPERPATSAELRALAKALQHFYQHGSKQKAIVHGFGWKPGGGPNYKRAEWLFESALAES